MTLPALTLRVALLTGILAFPLEARAGWTLIDSRNGIPVSPVISIGEDPTGAICAAFAKGEVWRQEADGWQPLILGAFLYDYRLSAPHGRRVVRAPAGLFWVGVPLYSGDTELILRNLDPSSGGSLLFGIRAFHDMSPGPGDSLLVASGNSLLVFRASLVLRHVDPGTTVSLPVNPMWASTCLWDRAGRVWISAQLGSCVGSSSLQCAGTPDGVWEFEEGAWHHFDPTNGLASMTVLGLFETTDGAVWAVHPGGVLSRFRNGAWSSVSVLDPCTGSSEEVIDWSPAPAGGFWLLTSNGVGFDRHVVRFLGEHWSCLPATLDPPAAASCLHVDDLDQLWVGTETGIIARLEPAYSRFLASAAYDQPFRVPSYQDHRGRLWGSLPSDSLYEYDGVTWQGAIADSGLAPVSGLLESSAGALYASTPGGTFVLEGDGPWTRLPVPDSLGRPVLTALAERAPDQRVFLTLDGRLLENTGSSWTSIPTAGAGRIVSDPGAPLLADREGRLWAATDSGCAVLSNGNWSRFGASDGFGGFGGQCIRILREGQSGDVWAASGCGDFRLLRFHAGAWETDSTFLEVRQLVSDALGRTWAIGFYKGLPNDLPIAVGLFTNGAWRVWLDFGSRAAIGLPFGFRIDPTTGTTLTGAGPSASSLLAARWHEEVNDWGVETIPIYSDPQGLSPYYGLQALFVENNGTIWAQGNVNNGTKHLLLAVPDNFAPQTELLNSIPPLVGTSRITASAAATRSSQVDAAFAFSADDERTPDPSMFSAAGVWQSPELSDGHHIVRAWSRDQSRRVDPSPGIRFFEVDATAPAPRIASPIGSDVVSETLAIVGRSYDPRYLHSELRIAPIGDPGVTEPDTVLAVMKSADRDTTLATFDTRTFPDGDYELRLAVTDSLGLIGAASAQVRIDNVFPPARLTVPRVRIHAEDGGDAYTNHGEVHLAFPPRAFAEDSDVDIHLLPGTSIRPEFLSAMGAPQQVMDLIWSPAALQKLAALDVAIATGVGHPDSVLRLFRLPADGGPPALVGGGPSPDDPSRFLAPIGSGGTYVLALGPRQLPAASGPIALDFKILGVTPRVLGRTPAPGANVVRVAFTLPSPSNVDAEVYNRAGRLIRRVAIAQWFPAGSQVVTWDGRTESGNSARDDVYLVSIHALGEQRQVVVAVARE